ncbi:8140_t:CDS:2 [Diversispora eburnea]|uniref:8140_t:CDS:1 n=1 Tax=Diversispora eburnea TaxID=1213867 RepID=A0A9N8ZPK9_9GLOM|nr:8140_t:CDS:2 [Diversispora eburnea]
MSQSSPSSDNGSTHLRKDNSTHSSEDSSTHSSEAHLSQEDYERPEKNILIKLSSFSKGANK